MARKATPVLELREVDKSFGTGAARVRAVVAANLTVAAGELVLIMGRSGSGKTTLLCIAGGLLRPDDGSVRVAGVDLSTLRGSELPRVRRDLVGFVFQRSNLLEALSVIENVEVPMRLAKVPRATANARAETLLRAFGLGERLHARPWTLAGGEQQRVAIARALANNPPLILADEPTANLDSEHGMEVVELLREISLRDGRAIVIVSHDDRLRRVADRVLWMEDGSLKTGRD